MDASAWVAVVAAAIALLSGVFTAKSAQAASRQADQARRQTDLQRKIHEDAQQPYVWVDLMPDMAQGSLLKLTVCNEGPSVATNIRVAFDPPFPSSLKQGKINNIQATLDAGLSYLAPGRRVQWVFDVGHQFFRQDPVPSSKVRITCDGPHGACIPNEYVIDPAYLKLSHNYPDGSLHIVAERIKEVATELKAR